MRLPLAALAAALFLSSAVSAAPAPGKGKSAPAAKATAAGELPGTDIDLKTQDGWVLKAKFMAAQPGQKTFILLHGKGQRKEFWIRLAAGLKKAGFGYMAMDLRGHGKSNVGPDGNPIHWKQFKISKSQNEFANMSMDVQAAVTAMVAQYVSEESVGIIGTDVGGSVGLKYAALHPLVPLVIMLSPGMAYQEVLTVNAMRAYKDRPILMVYGELDKTSSREAPILFEFAKRAAGERKATLVAVPNRQGVRLVTNPVIKMILEWIANPVRPDNHTALSTAITVSPGTDAEDSSNELNLEQ